MNTLDIVTAVRHLDLFLKVPQLRGARIRRKKDGNPFFYTGGFTMVFQLTKDSKKWAFRVWHASMGSMKERYQLIAEHLTRVDLPYFADFFFEENGLLVNGEEVDVTRMEWIEGLLLKRYIENNLNNKEKLEELANKFMKMCEELRENFISHGDLQEGNIIVTSNRDIKLIDYDSLCIPSIEGEKELVAGLKGYQHPSRFKSRKTSMKADYFSELIIYLSLKLFILKPSLWYKYKVKDTQYLLFTEKDFIDFKNSEIFNDVNGLSIETDKLLSILGIYLETENYTDLKPFTFYLRPPTIELFESDIKALMRGASMTLKWKVANALEVEIDQGIGKIPLSGEINIKPKCDSEYKITARGLDTTVEQVLSIKVFQPPEIKSIQVPFPKYENTTNLQVSLPQFPNPNLEIGNIENSVLIKIAPTITPPIINNKFEYNILLHNPVKIQVEKTWDFHSFFNNLLNLK